MKITNKKIQKSLRSGCGYVALLTASAAIAPASTAADTSDFSFEEIVVTAQKRNESLQDVPISVQVVGAAAIAQQNLTSVVTLAELYPSIHVAGSGRSSTYYMRGTGSGESQSFDQSVGTFVDNIYHGRSRNSAATFLDLDHVEILKGPQSTFFGNSAIAGAFNIVTKKPSHETEGWARGLIGPGGSNGGNYALEGAVNTPVTDELALRFAGTLNGQKGYLKNVNTDDRSPNEDNYAFRATALYEPSEDLEIILKGEFGKSVNKGGLILRQEDCPPPEPYTAAGFCALNLSEGVPIGLDTKEYVANEGNEIRLKTYEGVLTINYQMGDHTLTSTTGYGGYKYNLDLDDDGTTQHLLNVQAPEEYKQFSQEFRIASPVGETFEYMAGVYYQHYTLDIEQSLSYFFLTGPFSGIAPLAPYLPLGQRVNAYQTEDIYSAFGSFTWNVTDRLKLIGGIRGSIVKKDFDWALIYGTATENYGGVERFPADVEAIAGSLGLGNVGVINLDRKDDALLPSAKLQYQLNDGVMTYISYSRGFKSGGFSVADTSADPVNYPFNPEFVDAYELGIKGEFLDNTVSMNLALFWNDFSDLQVSIQGTNSNGGLINIVRNAAASRSKGVELEMQWLVSSSFKVAANATYLDSTYRSYPNAAPTYAQQYEGETVQDLSGRPTLYSPKWSGNVAATYTYDVSEDYTMTAEVIGIFSSSYFTYSTDDEQSIQDSYGRMDARLSLDIADSGWGFDIIGKNLFDKTVINFSGYQPTSFGSLFQGQEPPRQIMFQARYQF
ncbi:TonB-dependent receptor [Kordiimonas pumila]|uniref:TonB-dependent receptor n=1 Tax=Kordiimonas pumila TaxID=2161677 RepID=A0ABV7D7M5_9PROT|nr:TonB-dependent receptor [Kordiimonas pumila]